MTAQTIQLVNCEEGLSLSPVPTWVLDIEAIRVLWANAAGLEFWRATSVEELAQRDVERDAPKAVVDRVRKTITRILQGDVFQENWTFFPKGKPLPVDLHVRAIELRDGRIGMLNQAMPVDDHASDSILRTLAMLRHAKATIVFVNDQGSIYTQNSGSVIEFGQTISWIDWIPDQAAANEILRGALAGHIVEMETTVRTLQGERVHAILAHELRDPVSGDKGVLIQHFDVTERVEAERLVQKHLSTLREQQREILSLSTPFLDVGAKTLALPLIGRIDEQRANEVSSRLLDIVATRGIERVILDITGVISVDSSSIAFVRRLVDAVVLLGAKPIVTGIRAELARTLATSNEDLSGITIKHSLADGLAVWTYDRRRRQ